MPELPEVETVARTLAPHILDNIFLETCLLRPQSLHSLSMAPHSLAGCKITGVRRRAKLLIIDLAPPLADGPELMLVHLRMTGRLYTAAPDCEPGKHTRCWFLLARPDGLKQRLFFDDIRTFGQIFICRKERLEEWDFWRNLGPEPFSLDADDLAPRLRGKRPIKTALLDQKVIAGLGNIYVDEALFAAHILPTRPADSLSQAESRKLLRELRKILEQAILKKGSSIRDYRDADGKEGSFQKEFFVYGRGQEPCRKCGSPLKQARLAGRSTVYCETCQK